VKDFLPAIFTFTPIDELPTRRGGRGACDGNMEETDGSWRK